jgi:hypothetical protein
VVALLLLYGVEGKMSNILAKTGGFFPILAKDLKSDIMIVSKKISHSRRAYPQEGTE